MVSHSKPASPVASASRARLLEAAAQEFAARGFDGAKVDRIAARARVNKAMLYYHFKNKAALYREILRDVFGAVADAVEPVPGRGGRPEDQVRAFIAAIAANALNRPHFPPIWLREIAEGGRHLDPSVIDQMRRVLATLVQILRAGEREKVFRRVHPMIAHMSMVAPLLLFAASAPARERFRDQVALLPAGGLTPQDALAYAQDSALAALAVPPAEARSLRSPRRQSS